jgi:hypothetical protein
LSYTGLLARTRPRRTVFGGDDATFPLSPLLDLPRGSASLACLLRSILDTGCAGRDRLRPAAPSACCSFGALAPISSARCLCRDMGPSVVHASASGVPRVLSWSTAQGFWPWSRSFRAATVVAFAEPVRRAGVRRAPTVSSAGWPRHWLRGASMSTSRAGPHMEPDREPEGSGRLFPNRSPGAAAAAGGVAAIRR